MKAITDYVCDCDSSAPLCRKHELYRQQLYHADRRGRMPLRYQLHEQARVLGIDVPPERPVLTVIGVNEDRHPDGGSTLSRQYEQDHWRYDL